MNSSHGWWWWASGPARPRSVDVTLNFLLYVRERIEEGDVIRAVTPAWSAILDELKGDPKRLLRLTPRELEELVAGRYRQNGAEVVLTPRSGDGGVDVIATFPDFGSIRILDQVKRYKSPNLVTAAEVREVWSVLDRDRRASKAFVTTTSDFAPGVRQEFADSIPTRLDLRNGIQLQRWLLGSE